MAAQILIADDDEIARDVMAHVLSDRGHAVTVAVDGVAALAWLRRGRFAVAVLDDHLPLIDGATAAQRICRDGGPAAGTRFIGVTADPAGLEMRDADGIVFDAIVQKPLNRAAFVETVETCLAALRRAAAERDILAAWGRCGFERRPRARFAGEPGRDWTLRLGRAFDLSRPGNPDVVLVTEEVRAAELAELRTDGNLFTLPMVDVAGRWGRLADAGFDIEDPAGWDEVATVARGFSARRAQLATRFLSATTLPDKLLAYVFVSGRDLVPLDLDADEWTPTYPGFFPIRRVRDTAEKLVHLGMMLRESLDEDQLFAPPRFTLTPSAVACLTGAPVVAAPARRRYR
ncbi:response regulator [Lichenibacterium ramalinae]|uniref:Response regulator n=1 Tax=Lichenibacterium ramalinae TaxID=2316527 RepID=A0A4Q2RHX6_9HYPH|nr:response regulator [Lichenibacterium ramalinae]RYB07596.1 response regulator [Lichenibacterium ramalinae]